MMTQHHEYDVVVSGGGVAGASLAHTLAVGRLRVLILESTCEFTDRVRGEAILPWGVAEARRLGIYDMLREPYGHELRWLSVSFGRLGTSRRDLLETTPQRSGVLTIHHPTMQTQLLTAAAESGTDVRRNARIQTITRNSEGLTIVFKDDGTERSVKTRLLVGADGRSSSVRRMAEFQLVEDTPHITAAGVLLENVQLDKDTGFFHFDLTTGRTSLLLPQRDGRVRSYLFHQHNDRLQLSGDAAMPEFLQSSIAAGVLPDVFESARAVGPLASFSATAKWVEYPYQDDVVLIGDAAAISDPTWGAGLSSALRDVRILSEQLLGKNDWRKACSTYARAHDAGQHVTHTVDSWYAQVFMNPGPVGQMLRAKALPKIGQDSTRMPDVFALGPDTPVDEQSRRRFFGEE